MQRLRPAVRRGLQGAALHHLQVGADRHIPPHTPSLYDLAACLILLKLTPALPALALLGCPSVLWSCPACVQRVQLLVKRQPRRLPALLARHVQGLQGDPAHQPRHALRHHRRDRHRQEQEGRCQQRQPETRRQALVGCRGLRRWVVHVPLCVCGLLLLQLYYSVHCYYIGDPLEQERCLREATQASLANLVRTQAGRQPGRGGGSSRA